MNRPAVIGLIGGMSWESSAEYYRIINREMQKRLGGVHSARSLMWSVDFGEIERLQHLGDWDELTQQMIDAAIRLQRGGADFILMCTNTMRRMAGAVGESINRPNSREAQGGWIYKGRSPRNGIYDGARFLQAALEGIV